MSCIECIHHNKETWVTCKAFKDGIPFDILSGNVIHNKLFRGDKGIRYEPIVKIGKDQAAINAGHTNERK